jgi:hypothetical protein
MGANLKKKFEKSQKCRGKKKQFFSEPVPLHASFAHQFSCNTFFFATIFFLWGKLRKIFFGPPNDPDDPGYPRLFVPRQNALFLMVPMSI